MPPGRIRRRAWVRLAALLLCLAAPASAARAQDSTVVTGNLWLDFIVDWRFAREGRFFADTYYRTLFTGAASQRMIGTRPEMIYQGFGWLEFMGGANIRYTSESEGLDSWELRPYLGVQFRGDPTRRLALRNYTRLEHRAFFYTGSDSTSTSWRFRTRFEADLILKGTSFAAPGSWWGSVDAEFFVDLSDPVGERFADRVRMRFGVEYVRSVKWRFDAYYILQLSRDTRTSGVTGVDNFLRLRAKYTPGVWFLAPRE